MLRRRQGNNVVEDGGLFWRCGNRLRFSGQIPRGKEHDAVYETTEQKIGKSFNEVVRDDKEAVGWAAENSAKQ